jgi:LemA protein
MGNELDEVTGPTAPEGRDINVIQKQIQPKADAGTKVLEVVLWLLFIIPGLIFWFMKRSAQGYLLGLEQRVNANASQIDNYMEQRVVILENLAQLMDKSIDLDKDVMKSVAQYRSGGAPQSDAARNETAGKIEGMFGRINVAFEAYPDLRAQENIAEAMRQNANLQKEITAARNLYNDTVETWNRDIFAWPVKLMVAAKAGYTTRIPYTVSSQVKDAARGTFF